MVLAPVKRFYQRNVANGELRKHKGAYLAAALVGYLGIHALCGPPACAPLERVSANYKSDAPSQRVEVYGQG